MPNGQLREDELRQKRPVGRDDALNREVGSTASGRDADADDRAIKARRLVCHGRVGRAKEEHASKRSHG